MRRSGPTKVGGWEIFLQAGAKPEGKENASEEAGQISHQFAESDEEEGGSHGGKGNFEMRNSEIGNCRV